jgi:hypothetical protein
MRRSAALAALLVTVNCLAAGTYPPSPTDATLSNGHNAVYTFCTDKARYQEALVKVGELFSPAEKRSPVPSGERITVTTGLGVQINDRLSYSCKVRVSFVPKAGANYQVHVYVNDARQCEPQLVREDPSSRTGLVPEPSIGPPSC